MIGRDSRLPHTLVPLGLAASIVGARLSRNASPQPADADALAAFIAATVSVWEYADDPSQIAKPVHCAASDGVFRHGGEFHFRDGRAAKLRLAIRADDIDCVIQMLERADQAQLVRARALRGFAHKLAQQTHQSAALSKALRAAAKEAIARSRGIQASLRAVRKTPVRKSDSAVR